LSINGHLKKSKASLCHYSFLEHLWYFQSKILPTTRMSKIYRFLRTHCKSRLSPRVILENSTFLENLEHLTELFI
jgi:hypothetical protein